jgi:uncharacterized FlaG/YvyC family protein
MIKKIVVLILVSLFLGLIAPKIKQKTDLFKRNLNGKVKSIRHSVFEATIKSDKIEKGNIIEFYNNYLKEFNQEGNQVNHINYNLNGSLHSTYISIYDEDGNKSENSASIQ